MTIALVAARAAVRVTRAVYKALSTFTTKLIVLSEKALLKALERRVAAVRDRFRASFDTYAEIERQRDNAALVYQRELHHQAGLNVTAARRLTEAKEEARAEANRLGYYREF